MTSIGHSLFFCVPQNGTLLGYWDTVADRLFKIHNSLNIQGVFQKLPLFDPPIDPALLVRAAAEGLNVNAIVNGLNQPLPLVRFQLLISKATEICQEVKSLGASLQSALEKGDNEAFSLLRDQHESRLLNLAESVKYSQWQEAIKATQALKESLANAGQRYTYYQKLLGLGADQISIPQPDSVDAAGLQNLSFSQAEDSGEPPLPFQDITVDIDRNAPSLGDGEINTLTSHETEELRQIGLAGNSDRDTASNFDHLGGYFAIIPTFSAKHGTSWYRGIHQCWWCQLRGCHELCLWLLQVEGRIRNIRARTKPESWAAILAGNRSGFSKAIWPPANSTRSSNSCAGLRSGKRSPITSTTTIRPRCSRLRTSKIFSRVQSCPVGNQGQYQKASTIGFYLWMKGAVQGLYSNAFQLAFSVAKKAEQALQQELGKPDLSYIQSNYLDGMEGPPWGRTAAESRCVDGAPRPERSHPGRP